MRRNLFAMAAWLLVGSLLLAGCGQRVTAEEIVAHVRDTAESTQDAHAVVTVVANVQGIDISASAEIWEKMPNKVRAEVIDSSRAEVKGMVFVTDGEQAWLYEPDSGQVLTGSAGKLDVPLPQQFLASMQEMVQKVLDASEVELAGEEVVAGHETYKLTLTPKDDEETAMFPGSGTATLWVDKERWIVLKAMYQADSLGQGTLEVQSYELNPGVSDERFRFDAPEGVEVVHVEDSQPQALTLDEARATAGFPLLVPEYVPEGATLIEVYAQGETIILRYDHSPAIAFTVVQGKELPPMPSLGESTAVTVRGQSATHISDLTSGSTLLYWTENDVSIMVAGHISLDEAMKVAESLQ